MNQVSATNGYGGGFYMSTTYVQNLTFEGASLTSIYCSSSANGGVIHFATLTTSLDTRIDFTDVIIKNISAKEGRLLY